MRAPERGASADAGPGIDAKLGFLRTPAAYRWCAGPVAQVAVIETHLSWVFLAGDQVLKLKKPVCHAGVDYAGLAARETSCREEARLNLRLAPHVYRGVIALQLGAAGFALVPDDESSGTGSRTVDWLVWMRRLPSERMLDHAIVEARVTTSDIDALGLRLAEFYRTAPQVPVAPQEYVARFQREQARNRDTLLGHLGDAAGAARALDRLDVALAGRAGALMGERAAQGRIVEGHGDLRPEHVGLLQPPVVIDCLEFDARLRQVDPVDEFAFLGLECEMAGAAWIGPRLLGAYATALRDTPAPVLLQLYTAYRALLRARLALAHLLDAAPRTPGRWAPLARRYVERATRALDGVERVTA